MGPATLRNLLKKIDDLERRSVKHRRGIITAVGPLAVAVGGSAVSWTNVTSIGDDAAFTIGDVVSVLTFGGDCIVLGGMSGGGGGATSFVVRPEHLPGADWFISDPPCPTFLLQGEAVIFSGHWHHVAADGDTRTLLEALTVPAEFRPPTLFHFLGYGVNRSNDDRLWQIELAPNGRLQLADFHNFDAAPPWGNLTDDLVQRIMIHGVYPAASTGLGEFPE